jgi:uncharacterized membrane protein YqjE
MGFVHLWQISNIKTLEGQSIFSFSPAAGKIVGTLWLMTCTLLLIAGINHLLDNDWWWMVALAAVTISQLLIILYWPAARVGTIANVIILLVAIPAFGYWRFSNKIDSEIKDLYTNVSSKTNGRALKEENIWHLPAVVQNWLRKSGAMNREAVYAVRLKQKGLMRTKPQDKKWSEAFAEQYFRIDEPAFIWRVKMNMIPWHLFTEEINGLEGKGRWILSCYHLSVWLINRMKRLTRDRYKGGYQRSAGFHRQRFILTYNGKK